MISMIVGLIGKLLDVYQLLVILYVVLAWLKVPANQWTEMLRSVIEPVLAPVRRLMAKYLPANWMRIDWSPAALLVVIEIVQILL